MDALPLVDRKAEQGVDPRCVRSLGAASQNRGDFVGLSFLPDGGQPRDGGGQLLVLRERTAESSAGGCAAAAESGERHGHADRAGRSRARWFEP